MRHHYKNDMTRFATLKSHYFKNYTNPKKYNGLCQTHLAY
ncbi:hypothetical protein M917_1205 [Psychrobacter aquaticus CMS 56]|uniref:Uncharacterized protein n=1 Tax=Psychrobacter aquaticus CMS 56 TaxID=1354303 RepID=U4T736_9GAMM|nr:hypothetical protein M917_1205 [Psychrobacter aquaticus CMS 56]